MNALRKMTFCRGAASRTSIQQLKPSHAPAKVRQSRLIVVPAHTMRPAIFIYLAIRELSLSLCLAGKRILTMAVDPLLPHESFAEAMVTGLKSCIGDQLGKHCQNPLCTYSAGLLQRGFPPYSSVSIIQELGSQVYSKCMKAFRSSASILLWQTASFSVKYTDSKLL